MGKKILSNSRWGTRMAQQRWNRPQTLLEVLGTNRLVIEHHKGITCYGPEEIWVKTTFGQLRIRGRELNLRCMGREQLCIMGCIENLELMGRACHGPVE